MNGYHEVFINYTIVNGEYSITGAFDIYRNYDQNKLIGLPICYYFPSNFLNIFENKIHDRLVDALKSIGIMNGTMSIQCFYKNNSFYIFEAGYRLGGAQMYIFTNYLNDINVMEMMVNYSLTGEMHQNKNILENDDPYFKQPCVQLNIPVKSGIIKNIKGVKEIEQFESVLNITQVHAEGDLILPDNSTSQLALRIHISSENTRKLEWVLSDIYRTLEITDTKGNDMILDRFNLIQT